MSGEIVHDHDIAYAQPRYELLLDESAEYIPVGGGIDRDESTPAVQRDSADHRHRAPVAVRRPPERLLADGSPSVIRR